MADNVSLNPGYGSNSARTLDRNGNAVQTQIVQLDAGGAEPNPESLVSATNPLPVTPDPTLRQLLAIQQQMLALQQAQPGNGFAPIETPSIGA